MRSSIYRHSIFKILGPLIALHLFVTKTANAQTDIPIGTWRAHISYNNINCVAVAGNKVFGATENGLMMLDRSDNSLTGFSRLDGLSGANISYVGYDATTDKVIVAYEDGNLDLISDGTVINYNILKDTPGITGSRKINHISIRPGFAYLSADFGLVVFDLNALQVKETWRDIGVNGGKLKIVASTFKGDSVFLATEKGVLAGNLNTNLLDYNFWKRYDTDAFAIAIQGIATFKNKVYAAVNNTGIYRNENGSWVKENFLQSIVFNSLTASVSNLLITENSNVWQLDENQNLSQITDDVIVQPNICLQDNTGVYWIGDGLNGLVTNLTGSYRSSIPNGPRNNTSIKLKYYNGSIYSAPGGYSTNFSALGNNGGIDIFSNVLWTNVTSPVKDITDFAFVNGDKFYASSFGYGVEQRNATTTEKIFDNTNSPLVNISTGNNVNITAIQNSNEGLWIANYGAVNSLHLLKKDDSWQSYSLPFNASRYPTDLCVDFNGYVWAAINPSAGTGLLIFDNESGNSINLTETSGNGGLPNKAVRALAVDRDGYVWVGTDGGVGYFADTYNAVSGDVDAIKPIYENQYLLRTIKISCIKVDDANRKWIGSNKGVWLFNPTGEQEILNFTMDNSPLLSNVVQDIEINSQTGEVFFATDKGIISYRGDATSSKNSFQNVKIFPNPVTSNFNGTVGISGLATDAIVKITDINGRLLWQTQANGGTATWNVKDYHGNRAGTGVYVVFAASADGVESAVGKIAVVD